MTRRQVNLSRHAPADFGTIRERGVRFQAFYRREGKTHRAPKTFDTRPAARAWLAEQERAIRSGAWVDPRAGVVTLATYVEDWLDSRGPDLSPRTRENYRRHLNRWVLPRLGSERLDALTVVKVRTWRASCLRDAAADAASVTERAKGHPARAWAREQGHQVAATGRTPSHVVAAWQAAGSPLPGQRKRAGDGSAAIAAAYRVLRTVLNAAVHDELIQRNPCTIPGAGADRAKERTPATPEQVAVLALAMPDRYAAAVYLAAWSGLRSGELRGLARRHIDLKTGTVRVERAVLELTGSAPSFGPTKTAGSRRVVALPDFVVEMLRTHLEAFVEPGPDALVFCTADGAILTRHWLGQMFRRAQARTGLASLRWHDLRHTGASLAYAVGASVVDVQKRLGHTTMRAAQIYAHAFDSSDRLLADRLSAAFGVKETSVG